jgi:hypothetical protein
MRHKSLLVIVAATAMGLAPIMLHAAPAPGVCQQVRYACLNAGFVPGGAPDGNGLWKDCIDPILQGTTQNGASPPLPRVDQRVVEACRASNPAFGHPGWTRDGQGEPRVVRRTPAAVEGAEEKAPEKLASGTKTTKSSANTAEADPPNTRVMTTSMTASPNSDEKPVETSSQAQGSAKETEAPPARPSETLPTPSGLSAAPPSLAPSSPAPSSAGTTASEESTKTAALDPTIDVPPGTTHFGIEIATVEKKNELQRLWHDLLIHQVALVAGLQPRVRLGPGGKWRLIAGPFGSVAEAAEACNPFMKANMKCQATVFAGDQL